MDETAQLLEDCEHRSAKLTTWEAGFIQSLREQYDRKGSLSDKQREMLDKIWERIT